MMAAIRAATREDMGAVAALYERVVRAGGAQPAPRLVEYFERMFLESPWTAADCPSLVYEDGRGRIAGFGGVQVRPLLLDGRRLRMVVSGPLFVDTDSPLKAAGVLLHKAIQQLPADVWLSDGANRPMQKVWERMGGHTHTLYCMSWVRRFQQTRSVLLELSERPRLKPYGIIMRAAWPMWASIDRILYGAVTRHIARETTLQAELLTSQSWYELRAALAKELRLHVDYSVQMLEWQLGELAAIVDRGKLRAVLLRDGAARPVGAYLYYVKRGDLARLMHVSAKAAVRKAVLEHLMRDADRAGAVALEGRAEAQDLHELADLGCVFSYEGPLALIRAQDPAVYAALFTTQSLLTRVDGESWMGFASESFA
jgi:hypothetical protein